MPKIVLVGGGTRSGKSRFALDLAMKLGSRRLFVATAHAGDDEMAERIRKHQEERGPGFLTLDVPLALPEALAEVRDIDVVVLDCLTLWLANLLMGGATPAAIEGRVRDLGEVLARRPYHAVIVTSEVGLGIVPESVLGRLFRDVAGLAHQQASRWADEVYFAVLGTILRLKPSPEFVPWEGAT